MNRKINFVLFWFLMMSLFCLTSCGESNGYTEVNYTVQERNRYDNMFDEEHIPEQWTNYGIGDPYLLRYNGEYYLFVSTKDNNPGYKCWKSRDLIHYEYLGHFMLYNQDGTTTKGQLGQYAPEVYYWNGDFYMYGSPSGNGHYVYKSTTGLPYGDYVAVTNNFGLSIDGSVFIDDDETMTFLVAGTGGIVSYQMNSMTDVNSRTEEQLYSPLIKWTEGPKIIKHNGTYYLTYTGNHVKSTGYRVDYSYSTTSPVAGYNYPANNSVALKSLDVQNGLGHSSTVLGPNLDSYYMSYHNLDDSSGPIRSYNINRVSFTNNRMTLYGPTTSGAMVPMLPDFVDYNNSVDESKMSVEGDAFVSNISTSDVFSVEYNFNNIVTDGTVKLLFGYNGNADNYITIDGKQIKLYVNNSEIGVGTLVHDFDFNKLHTIRLNYANGQYRVYFDDMCKIEVTNATKISGGKVGYSGIDCENIGTTTFANEAFDSSDRKEAKIVEGEFFASNYLYESKLTGQSGDYDIGYDDYDMDYLYQDTTAVKLANTGDYLLYPIDVLKDGLYSIDMTHLQANAGSVLSVQIDNQEPVVFEIGDYAFNTNMNSYEDDLKFIKSNVCELNLSKGLHTIKFELIKGQADLVYYDIYEVSKYSPDYQNDLSSYIDAGASYLSLWKLVDDNGVTVHKAKAGVNNMILLGNETLKDYEVSVDIKISVNSANNSQAGVIVRCNNPSLYSHQVDQSAQGYLITFDKMQLIMQRINYNSYTTAIQTGNYSLNEYHNLRVRCEGNKITVYFDGEKAFDFIDSNPYSHGMVVLYSINAESFYKNVSIKGI